MRQNIKTLQVCSSRCCFLLCAPQLGGSSRGSLGSADAVEGGLCQLYRLTEAKCNFSSAWMTEMLFRAEDICGLLLLGKDLHMERSLNLSTITVC